MSKIPYILLFDIRTPTSLSLLISPFVSCDLSFGSFAASIESKPNAEMLSGLRVSMFTSNERPVIHKLRVIRARLRDAIETMTHSLDYERVTLRPAPSSRTTQHGLNIG